MDNVKFFQKLINPLIGSKLMGLVDDGQGFFGLLMEKNKEETILWVQQDEEGNGPGWLEINKT